jgi:hypothetical protein
MEIAIALIAAAGVVTASAATIRVMARDGFRRVPSRPLQPR